MEAINQSLRAAQEENELLEQLKKQKERPPLPQYLDGIEVPTLNHLVPSGDRTNEKASESSQAKPRPDLEPKVIVQVRSNSKPKDELMSSVELSAQDTSHDNHGFAQTLWRVSLK